MHACMQARFVAWLEAACTAWHPADLVELHEVALRSGDALRAAQRRELPGAVRQVALRGHLGAHRARGLFELPVRRHRGQVLAGAGAQKGALRSHKKIEHHPMLVAVAVPLTASDSGAMSLALSVMPADLEVMVAHAMGEADVDRCLMHMHQMRNEK